MADRAAFAFRWTTVEGGHDNNRFGPVPGIQDSWKRWRPIMAEVRRLGLLKKGCRLAVVCGSGLRLATDYRTAKERVAEVATVQAQRQQWPAATGAVAVRGRLYPPDNARRDALMYAKLVMDALEGIAYLDDVQATPVEWSRERADPANPRVEVEVVLVGPQQLGMDFTEERSFTDG